MRKQFVRERSSHIQRFQKTLEDANIKLDSVITDIIGLSGRRMIEALIGGETDPQALAALAHRRIKARNGLHQPGHRHRRSANGGSVALQMRSASLHSRPAAPRRRERLSPRPDVATRRVRLHPAGAIASATTSGL